MEAGMSLRESGPTMAEIPLGILTGIVGAPVFALLLRRSPSDWY